MTPTTLATDADFLLAIRTAPEDDLPRLAYADYLEERGRRAWADLLRRPFVPGACPARMGYDEPAVYYPDWPEQTVTIAEAVPGVDYFVDRGLVCWVRVATCERFLGGSCPQPGYGPGEPHALCPVCRGLGTVAGVAEDLFRLHPITAVMLADRRPVVAEGNKFARWWLESDGGIGTRSPDRPWSLPEALFDRLPHEDAVTIRQTFIDFASEKAALLALSAACVAHGRRLAGLPPLPPL